MQKKVVWFLVSCLAVLMMLLSSCSVFVPKTPDDFTKYTFTPNADSPPAPGGNLVEVLAQAHYIPAMKFDYFIKPSSSAGFTTTCWVKGNKMRQEFDDENGEVSGVFIYDLDEHVWYNYHPKQRTATKSKWPLNYLFMNFEPLKESPEKVSYTGDVIIDNIPCYVYEYLKTRWWIWNRYGLPVKMEMILPDNSIVIEEYKNYEFYIDIPDSMFEIPLGVQITEK